MTPRTVGYYEIKAELGRGGMAVVYLAHDPRLGRDVALKLLPHQFLHDTTFRARFAREARVIASLDHPAIVPMYDFGEEVGQPYLVMRLMPGGSLTERLADGPLPTDEATRIISRLAPALDELHARGIIHRDLKPANILFDQRDEPAIADFGIAKLLEEHTPITTQTTVGTPLYMSPEQFEADQTLDGRSDLYALGALLFQMLSGVPPYRANTYAELMKMHLLDPPPNLIRARPDLPSDYQFIIKRAMAKNRETRYQTAQAMADDLVAVSRGKKIGISSSKGIWIGAGLAVVTVLLLMLFLGSQALTRLSTATATPGNTAEATTSKPTLTLISPQPNSHFYVGQEIMVQSLAADLKGVARVELWVNNQLVTAQSVVPPVNSYAASQPWTPSAPGNYLIEVRAYNVANEAGGPAQARITVSEALSQTTPSSSPTDTPTPGPPTLIIVTEAIFVRVGPDTTYPELGELKQNTSARITGKNAAGEWWQIVYPPGSKSRGWVSANAQYSIANNIDNVPVIEPPPLPTLTPAPPTPTPAPPTIHYFEADRTTINLGEAVQLRWDLVGAKEAFLTYDDDIEGVVAPGEKIVAPDETTRYTLLARNEVGETRREVTIVVNAPTPSPVSGTPSIYQSGTSTLRDTDFIDLDKGGILAGSFAGADFFWNGATNQLEVGAESVLAILGYSQPPNFEQVTLDECRTYILHAGQETHTPEGTGLANPSAGDVACYITNEGRYGKFVVRTVGTIPNAVNPALELTWMTWD
jgi:serine/threonine-protein kinase